MAVGVLTFRAAGLVLRGAEGGARGGPVLTRLALVNLARSPWLPALAIAFLTVAVGLGGSARGLLIVDEPTSRQDENNARAVAALLAAAAHEEGQTVICATHDPAVIRQADKVVALDG